MLNIMISIDSLINDYLLEAWCGPLIHLHCFSFLDVLSVLFTPVGRAGLPVFDCPLDADSALRLLPTVPVFLVPVPLDVSFLIAIIKGVLLFIYFNV